MKFNLKHTSLLFSLALIGCGGGGSGGEMPIPAPVKAQLQAKEAIKAPVVIQSGKTTVLSYTVTNPVVEQVKIGAIGKRSNNAAVEIQSFNVLVTDGVELRYDLSLPQNTCFDETGKGKILPAGDQCDIAFLAKLNEAVGQETDKHLTLAVRTSDNAEDLVINKSLKFVSQNDTRLIDLSDSITTSRYLKPGSVVNVDVRNNSSATINALNMQLPKWLSDIALNVSTAQVDELHAGENFSFSFSLAVDQKTIDALKLHQDDTVDIMIEAANAKDTHALDLEVSISIVDSNDIVFQKPEIQTVTYTNSTDANLKIDSFTLENITANSVVIEDNTCQETLAAHASCRTMLKAGEHAKLDDYTKPAQIIFNYTTESGDQLSSQNSIDIDPVSLSIENDVHAKQGETFEINVTNDDPFTADLPAMSYFNIMQENKNISGLTLDPMSNCFNTALAVGESCQVKIHASEEVTPDGYVLHIDQANNLVADVNQSFYINAAGSSIIVETNDGSPQSNMGSIKLTNNGEANIKDIQLDRNLLPENVVFYNGRNGTSSYGTAWCDAKDCSNYCEINNETFNLAVGESCQLYLYSPSDVNTTQAQLTINALGQDYRFNLEKNTVLYVDMPKVNATSYELYHLLDDMGAHRDEISKYLHTPGTIEQLYWLDNDPEHNTLAVVVSDKTFQDRKTIELLKNIGGAWVNLGFPSNSYMYLGARAIFNAADEIQIFVSDNYLEKVIRVVGKPTKSGYTWHEDQIEEGEGKVKPYDDLKILMDQHNRMYSLPDNTGYGVSKDLVRLNELNDEVLYRTEGVLRHSLYFSQDDYIAVIDAQNDGSHSINFFNYQSRPVERNDNKIINHPDASYLLPSHYKEIYSVYAMPNAMSFYALVDAGHSKKEIAQCDIDYTHGHFGDDLHCRELSEIPAAAASAKTLKLIDGKLLLIGEKVKKQALHSNKLSIFEYVDKQWTELSYESANFSEGYQISELGHQYYYPIVQQD
ncbi:COG1470 family protein [Cysteiniphilum sp. 6C5]|uniref:COG1470 family protein n=1 Tax=unclassified Cysteiniphilum TaxID=2610889 RepID=UPI003F867E4B